jgi:endonuclease-3
MPRESKASKVERSQEFCRRLHEIYGGAPSALDWRTPFQLVIAVLLSAQTTDAAVNAVTVDLFARWPDAESMAEASVEEVSEVIRRLGFFRTKAAHCVETSQMIVSEYGGEVPQTMEELTRLPGVGRKSANLIMGDVFGKPAIVTDTHCIRLCNLIGLVDNIKEPAKVERELWKIIPPEEGNDLCHRFVHHGRAVCVARRPQCTACCLRDICRHGRNCQGDGSFDTRLR